MSLKQDRRVLIVLGLYRPVLGLLSRQLRSLITQAHQEIEVLICPDGPLDPAARASIEGFADSRLRICEFVDRVGVHRNFARGLGKALAASQNQSDLFAFCDQDDVWRPDKLARQVERFADPATSLCHSDARIVSQAGDVLNASLFKHEARLRTATFADLLVMNSVTGMTTVFRRDVAEAARPFPLSRCRYVLHDHWIALVASLLGDIRLIEEALVDYTQHAGNVMGAHSWPGSAPRARSIASRRSYLRRCMRQFLWRRRALQELRGALGEFSSARDRLAAVPVRTLFDCDFGGSAGGLSLSLAARLRGEWRQADQIWRISRGKMLCCTSP